ncbi:MAG: hypothetical protein GY756_27790 [bacterium]|nr:hypothetical protein [bacterium]
MYNYIPELKKKLEDKRYNYYKKDIKLVLARLGVEKYENEILQKGEFQDLIYINTQKSVLRFAEYLNSNKSGAYRPYDDAHRPLSYTAFIILQRWILNFPDELRTVHKPFKFTVKEVEKLEKTKEWIKRNKDILQLNKEMY